MLSESLKVRVVQVMPSGEVRITPPVPPTATARFALAAMACRAFVVPLVRWVKVRAGSVTVTFRVRVVKPPLPSDTRKVAT